MKKIAIPAILAATVLIAGFFAFMPVEKASTVHTTIQANVSEVISVASTAAGFAITDNDELRISSTSPFTLLGLTCTFADPNGGVTDATPGPTITVDGATYTAGTDLGDPGATLTAKMLVDAASASYATNGGANTIVVAWGAITGESGDETIDCTVTVLGRGDDTITATWVAV